MKNKNHSCITRSTLLFLPMLPPRQLLAGTKCAPALRVQRGSKRLRCAALRRLLRHRGERGAARSQPRHPNSITSLRRDVTVQPVYRDILLIVEKVRRVPVNQFKSLGQEIIDVASEQKAKRSCLLHTSAKEFLQCIPYLSVIFSQVSS